MRVMLALLETLKNYTSKDHPIKREELVRKMQEDYPDEHITKKMVRVRLNAICELEADRPEYQRTVNYKEYYKRGGEELNRTDFYYNNSITDVEHMFLIDSIMNSKIFTTQQAMHLGKRVQRLSGKTLANITPYVNRSYGKQRYFLNNNVLDSVSQIIAAMKNNSFLAFIWNVYDVVQESIGLKSLGERTVKPLKLMLSEGRYYMLARHLESEKVYTYSVDLMSDIKLRPGLKDDIRETEIEENFVRAVYALKRPYNMDGTINSYRLRVQRDYFSRLIDTFAYEVDIIHGTTTEETVEVRVLSSRKGMRYWLLHNYDVAVLIDNTDTILADELKEAVEILYRRYMK